jgi:hypothetical protein
VSPERGMRGGAAVAPGEAIVYTRYDREKSVVFNPQDFHRFVEPDSDLSEIVAARIEMSDLSLQAHRLESTPEGAIEDAAEIEAILGL